MLGPVVLAGESSRYVRWSSVMSCFRFVVALSLLIRVISV